MYKDQIIANLHRIIRNDPLANVLSSSTGSQVDDIASSITDFQNQLDIDTATWGLSIYEKELGIQSNSTSTLNERRSAIKGKMRGFGKVDIRLIQIVAESFENGRVQVQYGPNKYSYDTYREDDFNPPYPIVIRFVDTRGIPTRIDDLKKQIEEIKPCHLRVEYKFSYLTYEELDAANMTWDQLDSRSLTWDEFETGAWMT